MTQITVSETLASARIASNAIVVYTGALIPVSNADIVEEILNQISSKGYVEVNSARKLAYYFIKEEELDSVTIKSYAYAEAEYLLNNGASLRIIPVGSLEDYADVSGESSEAYLALDKTLFDGKVSAVVTSGVDGRSNSNSGAQLAPDVVSTPDSNGGDTGNTRDGGAAILAPDVDVITVPSYVYIPDVDIDNGIVLTYAGENIKKLADQYGIIYVPDLTGLAADDIKEALGGLTVSDGQLTYSVNDPGRGETRALGDSETEDGSQIAYYYPGLVINGNPIGGGVVAVAKMVSNYKSFGICPAAGYNKGSIPGATGYIADGESVSLKDKVTIDGVTMTFAQALAKAHINTYTEIYDTVVIDGDFTQYQDVESLFCELHVVRLVNEIKKKVKNISDTIRFEYNVKQTWDTWVAQCNDMLTFYQSTGSIQDFKSVMNDSTISEDDILNHIARGVITVLVTGVILDIYVDINITNSEVVFREV